MAFKPHVPARRVGFLMVIAISVAALAVAARVRDGGPDRIGWTDDLPAARRAAAAGSGKRVLLDFTAGWCPACQELGRTTWSDRSVAAAVDAACVPVRVDVDAHPDVARAYGAEYLPTLVLTDAAGHELRRSVGYVSADEFRRWLAGGA